MPVPTNISPATALDMTAVPFAVTLDAFEVPTDTLWFRFDKVADGYSVLVQVAAIPVLPVTYVPHVTVYVDEGGTLVPYKDIEAIAVPITVPLRQDVPLSYYFAVTNVGTPVFSSLLVVQAFAGPVAAANVGSIAVNDDVDGFPMAIVQTGDGAVAQGFPFPSGERADILPSNLSLWQDQDHDRFGLFDGQFQHLAWVAWAPLAADPGTEAPIAGNHTDRFYVGIRGDSGVPRFAQVTTVDETGMLGPTTWFLGHFGLRSIAPSWDDAVLYYTTRNLTDDAVHRWNLLTNTAMTDLVTGSAVHLPGKDLIVLADGSIVLIGDAFQRYNGTTGAVLNTYTVPPFTFVNRLAPDPSGTSFWRWLWPTGGDQIATFQQIRASDGAILQSIDAPSSTAGVWNGTPPASPEQALSTSCPFIITQEPLPPITFDAPGTMTASPGGYGITGSDTADRSLGILSRPQRRLRRAPHLADEQRWLTYDRFQLDLQTGVGLVSGQGVDPQIMLRWSNDGGHTWSNEHWVSAGRMGATKTRAIWRQLGRARTRTFEVVVSDPNRWFLCNVYLDVSAGDS